MKRAPRGQPPGKEVAAQESEFAFSRECIKWAKILAWIKFNIRWRNLYDSLWRPENVESRSERCRGIVQVAGIDALPSSRIQALDQRLNGRDGFRRRETTVSRAIDKRAAKELSVARFVDDVLVSAFVLNHHQTVALGMQRQHRDVDLTIENDIPFQVTNGLRIGADSRGIVQRLQI